VGYRYALDGELAEELLTLPPRQREQLITAFRELVNDPFELGEESFRDSSGRELQRRAFGRWRITFWCDHAERELRIVGVQRRAR
jgi:hypothetical protein